MRKTKILIAMITLMLVVIGSYFVAGTYAKYTSTSNGTAVVSVAKWNFEEDNAVMNVNVNFDQTVDASTLVNGKIAPGTAGGFGVNVKSTETEVGVDYSVSISAAGNVPENLVLYRTRNLVNDAYEYSDPITITPETGVLVPVTEFTGTLEPLDNVGQDVELYWVWEYETGANATEIAANDVLDTTDGVAAENLTFTISITGTQVRPTGA